MNSSPTKRRHEIEGLRTVAAVLVMVYHVWVGRVSGGVDVFFVVTGFFITLLILRQIEAGRVTPVQFFGRLVRRLMPGAAAVLVFVGLITALFAPTALQRRGFEEIIASALSVENLYLAFNAVDYLNAEDPSTPAQHFWAMSIQSQFYVLWLLVGLLVLLLVRVFSTHPKRTMMWVVLGVFVVSLGLSVWQTHVEQPFAYFVPWTRMWEFAIGAFVAMLGSRIHLRGAAAGIASWLALIALVLTGAVLPVETGFPGVIAAVPALAAAMILVSTRDQERWWAGTRVLAWKPFVWLGSIAFGIYLWHWPLLVLYRYWRGLDGVPGLLGGSAIIVGSIVLAYLTKKLLEEPLQGGWQREGKPQRVVAGVLVVAWAASVGIPVAALTAQHHHQQQLEAYEPTSEELAACWGYGELTQDAGACESILAGEPIVPDRELAANDHRWAYDCVNRYSDWDLLTCEFGEDDAEVRVALMGNSHAATMLPDFAGLAEQRGWHMTTLVGQNCVWLATAEDEQCGTRWYEQEELLLGDDPFDVVIVTGNAAQGEKPDTSDTVAQQLPRLVAAGSEVIVLEDNPRMSYPQQTCLLEAPEEALTIGECDTTVETGYDYIDPYFDIGLETDGVRVIETRDLFCSDGVCPVIIGNVIVYMDRHHITATYFQTVFPEVVNRIELESLILAA
ncbi:acyltransferase family protein [uncultured Agrococcus sp.]|uniref:acyltransferase family protein n=1 Tax=uncultured Agrococcus sp. TaxID=382258 RepID=UPI0025E377F2|nr:acyltransferase family protein [uncultured Agrococcus sp.]